MANVKIDRLIKKARIQLSINLTIWIFKNCKNHIYWEENIKINLYVTSKCLILAN